MAYTVTNTSGTQTFIIEDNDINDELSVQIPGRNATNYGPAIAQNFVRLLENFASGTAPTSAITGQIWFDTLNSALKVFNGTDFVAAGAVTKSNTAPTNNQTGDLWVNLNTQQVFLWSGADWLLVGPTFNDGNKSGLIPETLVDTINLDRTVVSLYTNNKLIAIISNREFTPKQTLVGFKKIFAGINLSSEDFSGGSSVVNKYYGLAEKAEGLSVNGQIIGGSSFMRADQSTSTIGQIRVLSNSGIVIGAQGQLLVNQNETTATIYNKVIDGNLDLKINAGGAPATVLRVAGTRRVGINTSNPQFDLDVNGNARVSQDLEIIGDAESLSPTSGALQVRGGLGVGKNANIGGNLEVTGDYVGNNISPSSTGQMNIGTPDLKYVSIYASNIGDESNPVTVFGNITGNVAGQAGTAVRLTAPTEFNIQGDIRTTASVSFDGESGGRTKNFTTEITDGVVSNRTGSTDIYDNDEVLINRIQVGDLGLRKVSRSTLVSGLPVVPAGAVFPFAGPKTLDGEDNMPAGYLLCDGAEVAITDYPELFGAIGYTYGAQVSLTGVGTFKLPDYRGRTLLGLDNMDNDTTDAFGGDANRVTDSGANTLGGSGGQEDVTLGVSNLPDHEHTMEGSQGTQYYAFRNATGSPLDPTAISGLGPTGTGQGQYLPTSGGVRAGTLGQSFNVLNPYSTVNWIIFTGALA